MCMVGFKIKSPPPRPHSPAEMAGLLLVPFVHRAPKGYPKKRCTYEHAGMHKVWLEHPDASIARGCWAVASVLKILGLVWCAGTGSPGRMRHVAPPPHLEVRTPTFIWGATQSTSKQGASSGKAGKYRSTPRRMNCLPSVPG